MKIRILFFVFIATGFYSCSSCNKLEAKLKKMCVKEDTVYQFKAGSVLNFSWDNLFIISGPAFPDEVEQISNISYSEVVPDGERLYLILEGSEIVEKWHSQCPRFSVYTNRFTGSLHYTPDSLFEVVKKKNTEFDFEYYNLR